MGREAILIVDKSPSNRELLTEAVTRFGHTVQIAANATDAIPFLDKGNFPIVISDIFCEESIHAGVLPHVKKMTGAPPFVIMTGFSGEYSFDRVLGAEAQEFIKKPFTADQLDNRLKRIFHERQLLKENEQLQQKQTSLNKQLKTLLLYNRMGERFAVIQVINKREQTGFEEEDRAF